MLESLRRAWPANRTVGDLAGELDIQPWRAAELVGRCEHLGIPLEHAGAALRLEPASTPLLGELIEWTLGTNRIGRSVIVFAEAASTNDVAWQGARRRESDGLVVLAETQSAGRGRFGRTWLDQRGASLLFSLLLLDVPQGEGLANRLVMSASVAIAEAIDAAVGVSPVVRWPNDLYVHGRKLAGILLESRTGKEGVDIVLGVGINCNQSAEQFPADIARTATSLAAELGQPVDRTALMREILRRLERWLADGAESIGELHGAYLARMDHQASRVRIHHGGRTVDATVRDVDPISGLIVELATGGVMHFAPSEVTLEWLS
ncbi:MAG: biotin--[acetyl-CoA-carboxylase] ligase [Phycisphaerae bacterium]|nr:biotin--[acetyl-CoA-carboxylase] ligase [Phycisphaerae bacterium]